MTSEHRDETSPGGERAAPTTRASPAAWYERNGAQDFPPPPIPQVLGILSISSAVVGFVFVWIGFQSAFEWLVGEGLRGAIFAFVVAPLCWLAGLTAGIVGWELAKGRGERGVPAVVGAFLNAIPLSPLMLLWFSALLDALP